MASQYLAKTSDLPVVSSLMLDAFRNLVIITDIGEKLDSSIMAATIAIITTIIVANNDFLFRYCHKI